MKKIILVWLVFGLAAFAHSVHLHIEKNGDDNLRIYSNYGKNKPCVECRLVVLKNNNVLFETKLDKNGSYEYKIKEKGQLTFKVNDNYGHLVKKDYFIE